MRKILSRKNLLVIFLASMFLGAGLRTSKDVGFLFWATFVDMFSYLVLALLIIAICREAVKKYKQRNGIIEPAKIETSKINLPAFTNNMKNFLKNNWWKIIIVIFILWIIIMTTIVMVALSSARQKAQNLKEAESLSQFSPSIDMKHLSSEDILRKIDNLLTEEQANAYKQHSLLGKSVGELWGSILQNNEVDEALAKILPILISEGWSEESARSMIAWRVDKSNIILLRHPEGWCKGTDCKVHSDSEIRELLREGNTSEEIIFGLFQELRVDSGLQPLPPMPSMKIPNEL